MTAISIPQGWKVLFHCSLDDCSIQDCLLCGTQGKCVRCLYFLSHDHSSCRSECPGGRSEFVPQSGSPMCSGRGLLIMLICSFYPVVKYLHYKMLYNTPILHMSLEMSKLKRISSFKIIWSGRQSLLLLLLLI